MFVKPAQVSMPKQSALAAMTLAATVESMPVTPEMWAALRMPNGLGVQVAKRWSEFRGPVEDLSDFEIGDGLHESIHGYVEWFVRYDGAVRVGFRLYDEEEKLRFEADHRSKRLATVTPQFLREVWTAFAPVAALKAGQYVGPNAPCPCGSGKKSKKCCGH